MSERTGEIFRAFFSDVDFPVAEWPDERRRGRGGRFPASEGLREGLVSVSDSVPDSALLVPESDKASSTSSDAFLI